MGLFIASGIPALAYLLPGLSYLIIGLPYLQYIGWMFSAGIFLGILYGIQFGRWNWKVHHVTISYPNLPEAFDRLRFVQISDVHVGSFLHRYHKVQKAIDLINTQDADYVFFTGDLVNNKADEMHGWESLFSSIKAKKGKFSILGNHDYGDYIQWNEQDEKQANLNKLIDIHQSIGFQPLLNDAVELGDGCWLLGVENWGKAPFRQSGKLTETLSKVPADAFKILLSHDPSHFDAQVLNTNIDLTLSGHTHGMQFGIERFGIKFSPVSFKYRKWAGLYQVGKQYLYVNRGFGFLGFPGRVGIYPEITHFTLKKAEH
jgi:predicted MPP superfamily phosphohydrolase